MMNVMIVDDCQLILLGLKNMIDWEAHGCRIVSEALNGKQALAKLETIQADILITDIQMPVMDGIELIRTVRELYPSMKIAVLSAFDDFKLVRTAFWLGAQDYLLKHEYDADTLSALLHKFRMESLIEKEQLARTQNAEELRSILQRKEQLEDMVTENMGELRNAFFRNIVRKKEEPDEAKMHQLGIMLPEYRLVLMQFVVESACSEDDMELISILFEKEIGRAVEKALGGYFFCTNYNEYIYLFTVDNPDHDAYHQQVTAVYDFINHYPDKHYHMILTTAASPVGNRAELQLLITQAKQACQTRFIRGKGSLIFYDSLSLDEQNSFMNTAQSAVDFGRLLRTKDSAAVLRFCKLEPVKKREQDLLFTRYAWELVRFTEEENLPVNCDKLILEMQFLLSGSSLTERDQWIADTVKYVLSLAESQSKYLIQFKQCIEKHYAENDLHAEEVAEFLGISMGWMGKTIYQETGMHFSDYLNEYRIMKAKELLIHTNLKVYEVSEKVGYNNVEHFTRVFKKIVGIGPKLFANSQTN